MISIDEKPDCEREGHAVVNGECPDCLKTIKNHHEVKTQMNKQEKLTSEELYQQIHTCSHFRIHLSVDDYCNTCDETVQMLMPFIEQVRIAERKAVIDFVKTKIRTFKANYVVLPDEAYEKADIDPAPAYELGRKDGINVICYDLLNLVDSLLTDEKETNE